MQIEGKIKLINEAQTFGTFQKREIVVVTEDQFPQEILIELHQDKVSLIDSHNIGDNIIVHINIRGKLWTSPEGVNRYFNSIVGWRIEAVQAQGQDMPPVDQYQPAPDLGPEDDGLPF